MYRHAHVCHGNIASTATQEHYDSCPQWADHRAHPRPTLLACNCFHSPPPPFLPTEAQRARRLRQCHRHAPCSRTRARFPRCVDRARHAYQRGWLRAWLAVRNQHRRPATLVLASRRQSPYRVGNRSSARSGKPEVTGSDDVQMGLFVTVGAGGEGGLGSAGDSLRSG